MKRDPYTSVISGNKEKGTQMVTITTYHDNGTESTITEHQRWCPKTGTWKSPAKAKENIDDQDTQRHSTAKA